MFTINGIDWEIIYVNPFSDDLRRSDGSITIGMTDWNTKTIYLCNKLHGYKLEHVLCHELCHAVCFSWDIRMDINLEEELCNFMANHGKEIIYLLDDLLMIYRNKIA